MKHILLVDDDRELCLMLSQYLAQEGFSCAMAHNGEAGLRMAVEKRFDAVVLDVMMPKLNGFDVVRRLRETHHTPVLMLTARGEETDSIVGLEIGADDYLAKPCSPKVLAARLRAVLRRVDGVLQTPPETGPIALGDLRLHPGARRADIGGTELELTGAEFNILELLVRQAGRVVEKETLSLKGLGRRLTPYDRSVDIHISGLRRKLGPAPDGAQRIRTVRGVGYLFALPVTP